LIWYAACHALQLPAPPRHIATKAKARRKYWDDPRKDYRTNHHLNDLDIKGVQMSSKESPDTEFPRSIGKVAARELALAGYTRFEHLANVSKKTLLAIHGVGPKSVNILEKELQKRGLDYKES
jgi:hypothetical protein